MHNRSKRLADVPEIGLVIYAEDIPIWSVELEGNIHRALEVTEDFLASTGLQQSPGKSALLLHKRFPRRGPDIDGESVCLRSRSGKHNTEALRRFEKSTRILLEAGLQLPVMAPEKHKISAGIRAAICVDPVPRNIHPARNEGRREQELRPSWG
ncbi:hypothetical protein MTO96_020643 [Rhipicephalus appendiculatus]